MAQKRPLQTSRKMHNRFTLIIYFIRVEKYDLFVNRNSTNGWYIQLEHCTGRVHVVLYWTSVLVVSDPE